MILGVAMGKQQHLIVRVVLVIFTSLSQNNNLSPCIFLKQILCQKNNQSKNIKAKLLTHHLQKIYLSFRDQTKDKSLLDICVMVFYNFKHDTLFVIAFQRFLRSYQTCIFTIIFRQQFQKNFTAQLKCKCAYNIFFLQQNFKQMKKTVTKLVVAVQSKVALIKRSSKTISKFINKVPCSKQELDKPTQASLFVQEQMNSYPIPPKQKASKREMLLSEKIKNNLQKKQLAFAELTNKLEQKLTFLELEEMRELLQFMNEKQINSNKIGLNKLKNGVNYFLESSQQNVLIEDHIFQSAKKLIDEIKEAQKKKVNQIF